MSKGAILKNPSEAELARALGMVPIDERDQTYDVAVVGAGPPASGRRSMRLPKVSQSSSSTRAPLVDRQARARVPRIISTSRPAFPARHFTGRAYVQAQNSVPEW